MVAIAMRLIAFSLAIAISGGCAQTVREAAKDSIRLSSAIITTIADKLFVLGEFEETNSTENEKEIRRLEDIENRVEIACEAHARAARIKGEGGEITIGLKILVASKDASCKEATAEAEQSLKEMGIVVESDE